MIKKVTIHPQAGKGLTLEVFKETFGKLLANHDASAVWKECGGVTPKKKKEAKEAKED